MALQRRAASTLGITWSTELFENQNEIPIFAPFVTSLIDGTECGSVWFAGGSEDLLISAFNKERKFLFLNEREARVMFNIALGILQHQQQVLNFSGPNMHHDSHKHLLAVTYREAFTDSLRKVDIASHLELQDVLIASQVPDSKNMRVIVNARRLHTKNQDHTKLVLEISQEFVQSLVDSFVATGGTFVLNRTARFQSNPSVVVRPAIASKDL